MSLKGTFPSQVPLSPQLQSSLLLLLNISLGPPSSLPMGPPSPWVILPSSLSPLLPLPTVFLFLSTPQSLCLTVLNSSDFTHVPVWKDKCLQRKTGRYFECSGADRATTENQEASKFTVRGTFFTLYWDGRVPGRWLPQTKGIACEKVQRL